MRKYLRKMLEGTLIVAGAMGAAGLIDEHFYRPMNDAGPASATEQKIQEAPYKDKQAGIKRERKFQLPENYYKEDGKWFVPPEKCAMIKRKVSANDYVNGFLITAPLGDFDMMKIKTGEDDFYGKPGQEICVGFTKEELPSINFRPIDVPFTMYGMYLEDGKVIEKRLYTGYVRYDEAMYDKAIGGLPSRF